jgi:hypothetical protein
MEQIESYTLTEDERGMVQPLIDTVNQLQNETQILLRSIIRLRKLEGDWTLQGDRLVRAQRPMPIPLPPAAMPEFVGKNGEN